MSTTEKMPSIQELLKYDEKKRKLTNEEKIARQVGIKKLKESKLNMSVQKKRKI